MNLLKFPPVPMRIVVLESPYFTLRESALARELFGKVIGVRLNAYLRDYGEGVQPVGSEDFFSHLVLICREDDQGLNPVYSFKITTLEACETHHLNFPLLSMLQDRYKDDAKLETARAYVNERRKPGHRLAYFGSRCKSTEVAWDEASAKLLNNIGVCALVEATKHFELSEFILFGMLNQSAYTYCEKLGMKRLFEETTVVDALGSTQAYVMHHTQFPEDVIQKSRFYSSYWENRIHIGRGAGLKKVA